MLVEKMEKGPLLTAPSQSQSIPTSTVTPGGSRDHSAESLRIAIEVLSQSLGQLRSFPQQAVAPLLCLESALRCQTLTRARDGGVGAAGASGELACVEDLAAVSSEGKDVGHVLDVMPISEVLFELLLSLIQLPGLGLLLSLRCAQVRRSVFLCPASEHI